MASKATPTSANMASHIVAIPPAPNSNTNNFTPNAIDIFCHTVRWVCFPIFIASATLLGWSVCITTSAVSIAASHPRPPMAIPTSLSASTGVSLIPSPTKATRFSEFAFNCSKCATLPSGSKSPKACVTPIFSAKLETIVCLSPDNI